MPLRFPRSQPDPPGDDSPGMAEALKRIEEARREGSTVLDLSGLQLTKLPEALGQLTALQTLWLRNNQLTTLPEALGQLTALQQLSLAHNQVTTLPEALGHLTALQGLFLDNNQLTTLPEAVGKLTALLTLSLSDNPGLGLPAEMLSSLVNNGNGTSTFGVKPPREILDYYFRIHGRDAGQPLNEFKLILVGWGGVGKTTLVEKLMTDEFKKFERTPGIKITQWPVTVGQAEVRAHVWDFGGQEIMHGTHRFFMTERALYVVLVNGREGREDEDAEYWLALIRSFAGEVPVLVLLHKWGEQKFELNRQLLREKYGENLTFLETDSGTGKNIAALRETICQEAGRLPGLKTLWPKAWQQVKAELPEARKSWLTFAEFRTFCAERGVPREEDQEALAASLHDLGLMLAYRKEEALRGFGVLHPTWVTDGIYQMLNADALQERKGRFHLGDFAEVLPGDAYPAGLHPYLLALMQKFRLCFPLDDEGREYLIPELLSKREPELEGEFPAATSLCFTYQYDTVLPEGLLPRFIVETYAQRETQHAWKTGVVLERANCRALVRGDLQARKITIRVTGPGGGRRELLGIVREHFERIHGSFTRLPVTELVPVPGWPEVVMKYRDLLAYEANLDKEVRPIIGGKPVTLIVKELLDGVDVEGMKRGEAVLLKVIERAWDIFGGGQGAVEGRLRVFISYSHQDQRHLARFRTELDLRERLGQLAVWADQLIVAGQDWNEEIFTNLKQADIFILLLSPESVASKFVMDEELPRAEVLRKEGKCEIVPILIRPCGWEKLDLARVQTIRPDGKAVSQARNRDVAWQQVMEKLDKVIARIRAKNG